MQWFKAQSDIQDIETSCSPKSNRNQFKAQSDHQDIETSCSPKSNRNQFKAQSDHQDIETHQSRRLRLFRRVQSAVRHSGHRNKPCGHIALIQEVQSAVRNSGHRNAVLRRTSSRTLVSSKHSPIFRTRKLHSRCVIEVYHRFFNE